MIENPIRQIWLRMIENPIRPICVLKSEIFLPYSRKFILELWGLKTQIIQI